MFIIYTKDKKPQVKFTVNLTREEVKELMQDNLFLDYPELNKEDFIIVEQEQVFKYPITDNTGIIREMTREELVEIGVEVSLEEGEVIKGNKIIKFAKPSQYHKWNGKEWTVDLEEVKEQKREIFKNELKEKEYSDFEYEGNIYQMGKADIPNFEKIKISLDILQSIEEVDKIVDLLEELDADMVGKLRLALNGKKISKEELVTMLENYTTEWRLKDNSMLPITYKKVKEIHLMWIFRSGRLNTEYNEINKKLLEAKTIEEIEAIKWEK